jgi:2-hydroxy-6-oxonona-2,4-dienedioate hydrolase
MSRRVLGLSALVAATSGVVASAVFAAYRSELGSIRRHIKERSRIAGTRCGPIEYAVEGSGTPALVIHGAGGGYDQGLIIAQSFPWGFQCIAPSRFGYLGTPLPQDGSPAAQADAHAALLESLGIDQAIVAAASAGAPSALELAIRHPERVRALILMVPRAYVPGRSVEVPLTRSNRQVLRVILSGADFAYWAAMRLARRRIVQFLGVPAELEKRASPPERERMTMIMRSVLPLSLRVRGIENDSITMLQPLALQRVRAPTLIVTARDDLFGTLPAAQWTAERIPGARLIVLDGGGHLFLGKHGEVNRAIADFLSSIGATEAHASQPRKAG